MQFQPRVVVDEDNDDDYDMDGWDVVWVKWCKWVIKFTFNNIFQNIKI